MNKIKLVKPLREIYINFFDSCYQLLNRLAKLIKHDPASVLNGNSQRVGLLVMSLE